MGTGEFLAKRLANLRKLIWNLLFYVYRTIVDVRKNADTDNCKFFLGIKWAWVAVLWCSRIMPESFLEHTTIIEYISYIFITRIFASFWASVALETFENLLGRSSRKYRPFWQQFRKITEVFWQRNQQRYLWHNNLWQVSFLCVIGMLHSRAKGSHCACQSRLPQQDYR